MSLQSGGSSDRFLFFCRSGRNSGDVILLEFDVVVAVHTGTGGNQLTDQDILLQTDQRIDLALADRKLSVAREALVIPSKSCVQVASLRPSSPLAIRSFISLFA